MSYYTNLSTVIKSCALFENITLPEDSILSGIWLKPAEFDFDRTTFSVSANTVIYLDSEIKFGLPFIENLYLSAGSSSGISVALAVSLDADGDFLFTLGPTPIIISFESDLLVPVTRSTDGEGHTIFTKVEGGTFSLSCGEISLSVGTGGEVDFEAGFSVSFIEGFTIGETDIVIAGGAFSPHFGAGESTKYLGIDDLEVYLPAAFSQDGARIRITADNVQIGEAGFSGTLTVSETPSIKFAGMDFDLTLGSITFVQNTVTAGTISGTLTLPLFGQTETIGLQVSIANDGFYVSLTGEVEITLASLGTLTLTGLAFGSDAGREYLEISGSIAFDGAAVASYDLPTISIDGLQIDENGKVSLPAGGLTVEVKKAITLFGVFQMEVDALAFGTENYEGSDYTFVGFSGGIKLCEGLPMGASAKGLQILWSGADVHVLCKGVGVTFEIPEVLTFAGDVELDSDLERFTGNIQLNLISLDMVIDGTLIIDKQHGDGVTVPADYTAFYVDLDVQLPAGIPLGSTGLAIYGFSGMFARHMVPDQSDYDGDGEFHWFKDWYRPDAASADQMPWTADPPEACYGAVGFGVGTTFGTLADNGFTFASNLALVFSFPGPVIMLIGRGNILRDRAKLSESTIFDTMIVFDGNEKSILAALAMSYSIPASSSASDGTNNTGWILDASASSEAFFDFDDPENWHVYMGQSEDSKRIRASILKLFEANSYLMLDNSSMAAGMSVGLDKEYTFGPAKVALAAKLWGDGLVTWAPQYLEAAAGFLGQILVQVFKFDFGLSAEATIELTTPTPYYLGVILKVKISLPWPFDDLSFTIEMEWEEPLVPAPVTPLLGAISVNDRKTSTVWQLDVTTNAHAGTTIDTALFANTVELDARPLVSFARNVMDTASIGSPSPTTEKEVVSGQTFEYRLQDLQLNQWEWDDDSQTAGHWEPVSDIAAIWQTTGGGNGTQLELYGDGPFSYLANTITGSSSSASGTSAGVGTPYADTYLAINTTYPIDLGPLGTYYNQYSSGEQVTVHKDMTYDCWYDPRYPLGYVVMSKAHKSADSCIAFSDNSAMSVLITPAEAVNLLSVDCRGTGRHSTLEVEITSTSGATLRHSLPVRTVRRNLALPDGFDDIATITFIGHSAYVYGFEYIESSTLDESENLAASTQTLAEARATLDPNSYYQIVVTTNEASNMTDKTQYAYFKTSSPPDDLAPYVSVAYAPATPLFSDYDLTLVGNENYLEEMYGSSITVIIYDENAAELVDEEGNALSYTAYWNRSAQYNCPYYTWLWLNAYAASGVEAAEEDAIMPNDNLYAMLSAGTGLPAGRTLAARVYSSAVASPDTPIFAFTFSTSPYKNFAELCADFSEHAFEATVGSGLDWDALLASDETFDTLWYGASYLAQTATLTTPVRPEITYITAAGSTRALLVSFPMPIEPARLGFSLGAGSGTTYELTEFVHTDNAQYLLVPTVSGHSATLPADTYTLGMTYTLDDGTTAMVPLRQRGLGNTESGQASFTLL